MAQELRHYYIRQRIRRFDRDPYLHQRLINLRCRS